MPIPHQEMRRIIKRRIQGTEGTERIRILKELLEQFPGYQTGPYGQLRKWVHQLIDEAKVRKSVKHQDEFHVPKDGCAQVALVGPPNAGKSTLLRRLTGRPVEVGDYRFTTLRPAAGILKVGGARVQLVDLPGLVEGARDGVGGGKILLASIRAADALVYCLPAEADGFIEGLLVAEEVGSAGIHLPSAVLLTKADLPDAAWYEQEARRSFPHSPLQAVDQHCDLSSAAAMIWDLLGLIRVWPSPNGLRAKEPVAIPAGSTVEHFVANLDRRWIERFKGARVNGPSAKFPWQTVGRDHRLRDGDEVDVRLMR